MTEYEYELLSMLQKECTEVIHAVAKLKRHGPHRSNPGLPESEATLDIDTLRKEIGDVLAVVPLLIDVGYIDEYTTEELTDCMTSKQRSMQSPFTVTGV